MSSMTHPRERGRRKAVSGNPPEPSVLSAITEPDHQRWLQTTLGKTEENLCLTRSSPEPHASLELKISQKGRGKPQEGQVRASLSRDRGALWNALNFCLPLPLSWTETAKQETAPQAGVSPRVPPEKHRCGKAGCSSKSKNSAIWSWEDPSRRFERTAPSATTNLRCPETLTASTQAHTPGPNHCTCVKQAVKIKQNEPNVQGCGTQREGCLLYSGGGGLREASPAHTLI